MKIRMLLEITWYFAINANIWCNYLDKCHCGDDFVSVMRRCFVTGPNMISYAFIEHLKDRSGLVMQCVVFIKITTNQLF